MTLPLIIIGVVCGIAYGAIVLLLATGLGMLIVQALAHASIGEWIGIASGLFIVGGLLYAGCW